MAVRAIRGAIQVDADERDLVLKATTELLLEILAVNRLDHDDLISIFFTSTPDLTSEFPALAARRAGFVDTPLMCASEVAVPRALPRTVRILAHVETNLPRTAVKHVYLGGARVLRPDLAD